MKFPIRYTHEKNPLAKKNELFDGAGSLEFGEKALIFKGGIKTISIHYPTIELIHTEQGMVNLEYRSAFGVKSFIFYADDIEKIKIGLRLRAPAEKMKSDFFDRLKTQMPWAWCTQVIIAINILIYILMVKASGSFWSFKDNDFLLKWGADYGPLTTYGEWWRVVTSCFLHAGFFHVALNMIVFARAGTLTERLYGHKNFLVIYFFSGIAGNFLSLILFQNNPTVSLGASGAIFGAYGALLAYSVRFKEGYVRNIFYSIKSSTAIFIVYNLISGFTSKGVDNGAHVGGLITGFLGGWISAKFLEPKNSSPAYTFSFKGLGTNLVLVSLLFLFIPRAVDSYDSLTAFQEVAKKFDKLETANPCEEIWPNYLMIKFDNNSPIPNVSELCMDPYNELKPEIEALELNNEELVSLVSVMSSIVDLKLKLGALFLKAIDADKNQSHWMSSREYDQFEVRKNKIEAKIQDLRQKIGKY